MGIIRPASNDDGAGRWAIALHSTPDDLLIGTRTAVVAMSDALRSASVPHTVYRRPSLLTDWRVMT